MRRAIILALLLVALAAGAEKVTLYCASPSDFTDPLMAYIMNPFKAENPNVNVVWVPINVADASTLGMDARIASGLPVHFLYDYMSRVAKYAIPKSAGGSIAALDLAPYFKDLADYLPGKLEPYRKDGQQLAVPVTAHIVAQRLNLTLMANAGYVPPTMDFWSLTEFEKMAGKVKAAKMPDTWPTLMFAENRSGDWMYMGWLASFGMNVFKGGKLALKPTDIKGLQVFKYWKWLQEQGFIPPEAAMMNDDHAIAYRDEGRLAAMGDRGVNKDVWFEGLVKQGVLKEMQRTAFYPYPRAPGVEKAPVVSNFELVMAFDTGTEAEKAAAARLVWWFSNTATQQFQCKRDGKYPTRKSVQSQPDAWWQADYALMVEQGTLDLGETQLDYDGIRGAMFPQLQKLFTSKATPQEAYVGYIEAVKKVIGEK